jgi:hypothetical protein
LDLYAVKVRIGLVAAANQIEFLADAKIPDAPTPPWITGY